MAVEIIGDGERQEGTDAQRDRPEHLVADIEVVMGEAWRVAADYPVVRVGGGIPWSRHSEVGTNLHALEDEIDAGALLPLHLPQPWPDVVLFANALLGPFKGNALIAGESL